jgi:ABC-type transport system substrate-binding protein
MKIRLLWWLVVPAAALTAPAVAHWQAGNQQGKEPPPAVAALQQALARPADRVQLASGEFVDIVPLAADTLLDPQFAAKVTVQTHGTGDEPGRQLTLTRDTLAAYLPFEVRGVQLVAEFEKIADLPALARFAAVEQALSTLLQFHLTARDRPLEGTNRWADVRTDLERRLLDARRRLLRALTLTTRDAETWPGALRAAERIVAAHPADGPIRAEVARLKLRYAAYLLLATGDMPPAQRYGLVRQQLEWVEAHAPRPLPPDPVTPLADALAQAGAPWLVLYNPDPDALHGYLTAKARRLLESARATKEDSRALEMLRAAEAVWPRLEGLDNEVLRRQGKYTVLYVGVRSQLKYLSPALASTDAERQAVELLFAALVQPRPSADGSLVYAPQLAAALPGPAGDLRAATLRPHASWADGTPITAQDVQHTFALLTNAKLPGNNTELGDLLELARPGDDPQRVAFGLRQGLLDPQAPLAFKLLPRQYKGRPLSRADDEEFAQAPLGCGPYEFAGAKDEHGRHYLRFVASSHYAASPGRPPLPFREVRLFVCQDPDAEFRHPAAPAHLVLDVRPQEFAKLKMAGAQVRPTLPGRRVYFLALNHRVPALADDKLRRALAHGIDRERLLTDHFGGGPRLYPHLAALVQAGPFPMPPSTLARQTAQYHHALNGPFPAGSWAVCPDARVPARLFDPAAAETFLKQVQRGSIELKLKVADDDPRALAACQALAAQLETLGAKAGKTLKVTVVPLPPHQLRRDVLARNYELAYWHHDFANDLYSLLPLFDPRDEALRTGSNYLGYKDDGTLLEWLQKAAAHRDFAEVRRLTQEAHVALVERMPLVPLWQLEYFVAVRPGLELPPLDAERVFCNIDEWKWN